MPMLMFEMGHSQTVRPRYDTLLSWYG